MHTILYDYTDNVSSLMLMLYGLLILGGIGFVIYGLFIMPRKECEFDGRTMKLKYVPIGFRLLMQGFPVVLGIAALLGGALNLYDAYRCDIHYNNGNVQQVTGELSQVQIYRNPFDEDADPDVDFVLEGESYSIIADYEKAEGFADGVTVTMEYGYAGEELLIYYIYTGE